MKHDTYILSIFGLVVLSSFAHAQNVNIPDNNFKTYLVSNSYINTNADGEIQVVEAAAYTGSIFVDDLNISDLTGIEAFSSLSSLFCNNNLLTSLNVSSNTALTSLMCFNNQITRLDISANTNLSYFICANNAIASLDVSANTALTVLNCASNELTSLDVAANMALEYLYCDSNHLTYLDVSSNTSLVRFYCNKNQLTNLNVKNGNNRNLIWFDVTNNPYLTCIQVDSAAYMNNYWSGFKDSTASFNENCSFTGISDRSTDRKNIVYPNPSSGIFTVNSENSQEMKICVYDLLGNCLWNKQSQDGISPKIDLSSQPKGIYFMEIVSGDKKSVNKIVLQ